MLTHTFLHIKGIGPKTEQRLWETGIVDWNPMDLEVESRISPQKRRRLTEALIESKARLDKGDAIYFAARLTAGEHWRLFPDFRDKVVYLDIETDGLDAEYGQITTIALYDGEEISWFVNGRNLDDFVEKINQYGVIVTYNGKCFDIPFIQGYFGIRLPQAHIDLRYVLSALGYKGGLKQCEQLLGFERAASKGIDGYLAVLLWSEYQRSGNERALETLLAYNIEDVINLELLMVTAYNMRIAATPFESDGHLALPNPPPLPFGVDEAIVDQLTRPRAVLGLNW